MGEIESGVRETLLREGIKKPSTAPELMAIMLAKRLDNPVDSKDLAGISRELRQWIEEAKNQSRPAEDTVDKLASRY